MTRSLSFRADIEGLRAVAVLLVLLFHAGLPVSGGYIGVDIFFVISGFLITGLLLREAESDGRISLAHFYARRFRRLLPAATLVLIVSLLATWSVAPASLVETFSVDVAAAAAYFANWRFAARSVNYLAEDIGRSPVLHFWSLAVEEQFYFVWPLLIICSLAAARRLKLPLRPFLTVALILILLPSFGWSILLSTSQPEEAFFVTTTRLWELAAGALLALFSPLLTKRFAKHGRIFLWTGASLIVLSALAFNTETQWPSYRAVAPVLGTMLLILVGTHDSDDIVLRILRSRPMVWLGGLSYSIYLWHWPLLVIGQDWLGGTGPAWGTVLVTLSLFPAWLSHRFVEAPLRFSRALSERPWYVLSLGANLSFVAIVSGLLVAGLNSRTGDASELSVQLETWRENVVASPASMGAGALGKKPRKSAKGTPLSTYSTITPNPLRATDDLPRAYMEGCQAEKSDDEPNWCISGDPQGSRRVALLGDSKILQYYDAFDAVGKALSFRILVATKSGCPFSAAPAGWKGAPYPECATFNRKVFKVLQANPPHVVITSQRFQASFLRNRPQAERAQDMVAGLVSYWEKLNAMGTEVVVLVDNPSPPEEQQVYQCVHDNPGHIEICAFERNESIAASGATAQLAAAARVPGTKVIDLTDYICPRSMCAPVIGDVLIYRQGSHITNTYAKTLAPHITRELRRVLVLD